MSTWPISWWVCGQISDDLSTTVLPQAKGMATRARRGYRRVPRRDAVDDAHRLTMRHGEAARNIRRHDFAGHLGGHRRGFAQHARRRNAR